MCEVVRYSDEFYVWRGPVFWRVLCVRWSGILMSSLCEGVLNSGGFYV